MHRNSILNDRHRALGSTLDGDTWNGMPIPWCYYTDPHDEVVAVRSCAGLYDISALNIVNVTGPDAESVLDMLVAKDITRLAPGTSVLAAEVDEDGAICDDIMIIRDAADRFRVSHGSGKTPQNLRLLSAGRNVRVERDLDVHILSLQGPKSLAILAPHVSFDLARLPYFRHENITLFGKDVVIARGGYSGERGYEVYCKSGDAVELWDRILGVGKPFGAVAASWNSLDLTRIEAALLFFPFEMPEGDTTPWEVNMGWGVDVDKAGDFIGKQAVLKSRGKERFKQAGLVCRSASAVEAGARILKDGKDVGVVTSASFSRYLMLSLAMVHLKPEYTAIGTAVEVVGSKTSCKAHVSQTPFYDPMRLRTHPQD
ncbi:aminomethyltransferase [Methylophilaceae bacterium]|nr:aminomethyltransferase [Methylophilaceae bacterium]